MLLKRRLKKVAEYIKYSRLADIGSDHAYLPIYLVKEEKINFAISGEIVEGPHKISVKNVVDNNLENKIICKKGSGLSVIELSDNIEVITICGMGGKLIATILEEGKDKLVGVKQLVLQPNVASNLVRIKLEELGYKIVDEDILEEDGHIYEIIVAEIGKMTLTEDEKLFGVFLADKKQEDFIKKYEKELEKVNYILESLHKAKNKDEEKIKELETYKEKINKFLV